MSTAESKPAADFIRQIIADDVEAGRHSAIITRFPPEPNGYLHIGHAKSICLNFGVAGEHGGICHLRFDDTNPNKEEQEYIDAIKRDVAWLGFDWGDHEYYASDYFDQLYEWAKGLIRAGKAYVDEQSADEVRQRRGTLKEPGEASPYRDRPAEESLDLLERMKAGEFPDGSKVLRAKIDMAAGNLNLRDPVLYRVQHQRHLRTGDKWCIYPMYDFAHGQSDWVEGVTHSLCTLEFQDHRPLYEWLVHTLAELGLDPTARDPAGADETGRPLHLPRQIEFARLNLTHTVMSKRKLLRLVQEGYVAGWDDPRMPTLQGMRRRGYPPRAIREFCHAIGNSKRDQTIQIERLEHHVRDVLNRTATRYMAVLDPLKVVVEDYEQGRVEHMEAVNNPEDEAAGTRSVPFTRELFIERSDFMEDPPKKFFRLAPGREVRLRYGYWITCKDIVKDEAGNVVELRCTHDPQTRGGQNPPDGRKVKGTLHWVPADHAVRAEVRQYDHLFTKEDPDEVDEPGADFLANINGESLTVLANALIEPAAAEATEGETVQFERTGYFCVDPDSTAGNPVFNRTVGLKDTWAKMVKQGKV